MEEIKEEVKKLQNRFEVMLMQANTAIMDANERLRLLSQRFGRIISKFDKIDNKNTVFLAWLQEYIGLKDNVTELWSGIWNGQKEIMNFCNTHKISLRDSMALSVFGSNVYFGRFHTKVEVLDDIIVGLLEGFLDNVHLEQNEEIERKVKEAIEKTNELPMFV